MNIVKLKLIAWLIERGFKPHRSNITHLKLGYGIGLICGLIALGLLALVIAINVAVLLAVGVAILSALFAGWVKEKNDGARFDWLDLIATAIGGVLSGITILIIYYIVTLIFI